MGLISALIDIYENVRPTRKVKDERIEKTEYPENIFKTTPFTGDRKQDQAKDKPKKRAKEDLER